MLHFVNFGNLKRKNPIKIVQDFFQKRKIVGQIVDEILTDGSWEKRHDRDSNTGKRIINLEAIIKTRVRILLPHIEDENRVNDIVSDIIHKALGKGYKI